MISKFQAPLALEEATLFKVSPASPNLLQVPREMREYINEHGEGRRFNLESCNVRHQGDPDHIEIELAVTNKGAELLEPFTVRIVLADPAAVQLAQLLDTAVAKPKTF